MSLRLQDELHWHLLSTNKRILSTLSVVFSYQEPIYMTQCREQNIHFAIKICYNFLR